MTLLCQPVKAVACIQNMLSEDGHEHGVMGKVTDVNTLDAGTLCKLILLLVLAFVLSLTC